MDRGAAGHARRVSFAKREGSARAAEDSSSPRIAHTLTACCRCRTRKTRCDPGLPRCGPCERTNSHCEYFDQTKGTKIPRNYVVHLQHKVRDLEKQLAELEKEDLDPDPEDLMRGAAAVRIQESDESKFLGPSSGIAITRLVMQLAKQFTDSKSITDIVPNTQARMIKERFAQEEAKPTSKIYPLISSVAAEDLPNRDLTDLLVGLFNSKVQAMYPIFHEPSFAKDVEAVYQGSTDAYQNFALRMVIAISLQRMDTQYAGLADSYYLAALKYLEPAVKPMNIKTIQCFTLIAGYSLLTPTRTAVYYVIGLAVRLAQALGLNEEKTITRGLNGKQADPLDIDMRRRIFWIVLVMELGLSHSLGRPSILATAQEHIDVDFFQVVDDEYISANGITPSAPPSLKKWIAIHFFRMRLLQLEIRRKLYQRKRSEPKDDQDPWFKEMEAKMVSWRDASPTMDAGSGMNMIWFIGRYNTMIVFLFRPSPQVPRPSLRAAIHCYEACVYNIDMHRNQIRTKSVELTWIFTQSIFMAINTVLWTLSYYEIRRAHSREEVEGHLSVALECILVASERWPGVASAHELYQNLIAACMKIYDKDGDIPIAAGSPSESMPGSSPALIDATVHSRSRTASPATASSRSVTTPTERIGASYGDLQTPSNASSKDHTTPPALSPSGTSVSPQQSIPVPQQSYFNPTPGFTYDPSSQFNPLPDSFTDMVGWNPHFDLHQASPASTSTFTNLESPPPLSQNQFSMNNENAIPVQYSDYLYPQSWDAPDTGLNHQQQMELMQSLVDNGAGQLETMIQQSNAFFYPKMSMG
ncbi:hypothetical protein K402DRAFT_324122 [Aulographum hederae CBS 113979]|uniref:Zn(2)-C6 fungal-type domain-containing protein n=1 Tax=Aulographum hederae CBS 113979 TaxID=1176131 RepID=A0A6G1HCK3_9PEZI|nr:hypothetical protein K402DRAFT_324122 [Aulographum hederae CBS 113979]